MEVSRIHTEIELKAHFMDSNIDQHIVGVIRERYKNWCSKRYGYIIKIEGPFQILDNFIDGICMFSVSFNALTLKPVIGKTIESKVEMIFGHGVFTGIETLKILIPTAHLVHYEFDPAGKAFTHRRHKNKRISVGDEVLVRITDVRYSKKKYSCIGTLVDS